MSFIKEWFSVLLTAAGAAAAADMFFTASGNDKDTVSKYVKLVISLCVCAAVFLPLFSYFSGLAKTDLYFDYKTYDKQSNLVSLGDEYIIELAKPKIEKQICETIVQKFGINEPIANIEFDIKENEGSVEVVISSIVVYIDDKDKDKAGSILEFCENLLYCKAEIEIKEEK